MTPDADTLQDISKRAHEIYANVLREQVETDNNIGKILLLDVETGHHEIDADGIAANDRLRAKHPDTDALSLFALRIGYDAVYSFGGAGIRRTRNLDQDSVKDYSTQRHEWLDGFDVKMLAAQLQQKHGLKDTLRHDEAKLQERGKPNMMTTLAEVQRAASDLPISEQLQLAAYICEHVRQAVPAPTLTPPAANFSMEDYLAQCDTLAEQIGGEFDSAEDMRKIREERMAEIG